MSFTHPLARRKRRPWWESQALGYHPRVSAESPAAAPSEESRRIGHRVGPYEILDHLGSGAMGAVYRARHLKSGQEVALKLISASAAQRRTALVRFKREADTMRRLRHPNVVAIVDFGMDGQTTYLAMELLRGATLEQRIASEGKLPLDVTLTIAIEIANGLIQVHDNGFVHRDLKPGNVMLVHEGFEHAKILDFGLVGIWTDSSLTRMTAEGHTLGTPVYMAPEQLTDSRVGPEADLYALGMIIFEMLTGAPAFLGSLKEVIAKHMYADPPSLPEHHGLGPLVAKLLSKRPEARIATARAVADELAAIRARSEKTVVAAAPPGLSDLLADRASQSAIDRAPTQAKTVVAVDQIEASPPAGRRRTFAIAFLVILAITGAVFFVLASAREDKLVPTSPAPITNDDSIAPKSPPPAPLEIPAPPAEIPSAPAAEAASSSGRSRAKTRAPAAAAAITLADLKAELDALERSLTTLQRQEPNDDHKVLWDEYLHMAETVSDSLEPQHFERIRLRIRDLGARTRARLKASR
jgi:eukaryotic-like serine/threonine-protein kinase